MGIGFRNSKKIRGKTPGFLKYTKQDMKRVGWCNKKGGKEWKVELNINKKIHMDPKAYKDKEALAKMYEYYKYYYDKYNKQ